MEVLLILIIAVYGLFIAGFITAYILRSLGLYRLAKNRGLKNAWLSWIPVGDSYIMGALCEQSPYIHAKFPRMRRIFPAIVGGYLALLIPVYVYVFLMQFGNISDSIVNQIVIFLVLDLLIILAALFVYAVSIFVLYHIFKVYEPKNAVLYTVLCAIFKISFVFLFVIRKKQPGGVSSEQPRIASSRHRKRDDFEDLDFE